ncbi:hypothetical protein Btru_029227 [Bulinus truncatus]|nr:hypothetical protein Btru_029227 [Bulinus truncatus]
MIILQLSEFLIIWLLTLFFNAVPANKRYNGDECQAKEFKMCEYESCLPSNDNSQNSCICAIHHFLRKDKTCLSTNSMSSINIALEHLSPNSVYMSWPGNCTDEHTSIIKVTINNTSVHLQGNASGFRICNLIARTPYIFSIQVIRLSDQNNSSARELARRYRVITRGVNDFQSSDKQTGTTNFIPIEIAIAVSAFVILLITIIVMVVYIYRRRKIQHKNDFKPVTSGINESIYNEVKSIEGLETLTTKQTQIVQCKSNSEMKVTGTCVDHSTEPNVYACINKVNKKNTLRVSTENTRNVPTCTNICTTHEDTQDDEYSHLNHIRRQISLDTENVYNG